MAIFLQVSAGLQGFYSMDCYLHLYRILGSGNPQVQANLPAGFFMGFLQVPSACYPLASKLKIKFTEENVVTGETTKYWQCNPSTFHSG